jgi:hypothetical protein
VVSGLNVNTQQLWNDGEGGHGINGLGGCPSVTLSITNSNWTGMVVNMVSRDEKSSADKYPFCKTAQIHPRK